MVDPVSPITGMVFDIQRCSLHDGPGIRTTVFLKGCPLRCQWCHNPESGKATPELAYLEQFCVACGECVRVCPQGAHRIEEGRHLFDRAKCEICGKCAEVCVGNALRITGKPHTLEQVMKVVLADEAYYRQSGGGMTLSGGEPLQQLRFATELLAQARAHGIHTCVETSAAVPPESLQAVAPLVDLFLIDYKVTGPEEHRRLTSLSNERILANLKMLYGLGAKIRLRCPLVPGVNDSEEHLRAIAELAARYPNLDGVDLMPYHNIGNGKYERYGLVNPLPGLPTAGDQDKERWLTQLKALGCVQASISE